MLELKGAKRDIIAGPPGPPGDAGAKGEPGERGAAGFTSGLILYLNKKHNNDASYNELGKEPVYLSEEVVDISINSTNTTFVFKISNTISKHYQKVERNSIGLKNIKKQQLVCMHI